MTSPPVENEKNEASSSNEASPSDLKLNFTFEELNFKDESTFHDFLENLYNLKLPNGQVGKPYSCVLTLYERKQLLVSEKNPVILRYTKPFEELGFKLGFKDGTLTIQGSPIHKYEGSVTFTIKKANYKRNVSLIKMRLLRFTEYVTANEIIIPWSLLINPDPWTLWKNNPAPSDEPYQKSEYDSFCDKINESNKVVLAASLRGRSHAHNAKFRDDHFFIKLNTPSGWNFFAVADGAGSAIYSREGSRIACEVVTNTLSEELLKYLKQSESPGGANSPESQENKTLSEKIDEQIELLIKKKEASKRYRFLPNHKHSELAILERSYNLFATCST